MPANAIALIGVLLHDSSESHLSEFSILLDIIQFSVSSSFSVNSAFLSLRQLIPTEPKTRKLSKIETLRLAKSYIEHLFAMLITGIFIDIITFAMTEMIVQIFQFAIKNTAVMRHCYGIIFMYFCI